MAGEMEGQAIAVEEVSGQPEAAAAPVQAGQATDVQMEGQVEGQAEAKPPVSLETVFQRLESMNRELGQFRRMQSVMDRLPQTVDDRLTKWQEAQRKLQLPPEQQQAEEQAAQQERAYREFTRKEAIEAIRNEFGDKIAAIEKFEQREQQQAYYSEFYELAGGEEEGKALEKVGIELFNEKSRQLDSDNPIEVDEAIKWIFRAKANPEFLVLQAQRLASKQQKTAATGLVQNRLADGKLASQTPKGKGNSPSSPRKRMDKMNQAELEDLASRVSADEFGKMLAADKAAAGIRE